MSWNAQRFRASDKRLCHCGRPALYRRHRTRALAWRHDHPLCRQCLRGVIDSTRQDRAGWVAPLAPPSLEHQEVA